MSKNSIFLNYVSEKLTHAKASTGGHDFVNISVPNAASKTGYISLGVNPGQVMPSTKRDGTPVAGCVNVLLGKPEGERTVSICTKAATAKKPAVYAQVKMTNQAIADAYEETRKAYRTAKAAAVAQG